MSKKRRLSAIMFTDIVGYTALMQQDEKAAATIRAKHREIFDQEHVHFQGEILQYYGDGTLSVFQSGVQAIQCAIAIQQHLNTDGTVPLRIGLHLGDIVFDGTEIYGDSVNITSRIESMGVAGSVLISAKLNDEIKNHPEITTLSLGFFEFKNIQKAIEVFAVSTEGLVIPDRSALKGKFKESNKTIAVLPFLNMSSKEENEYFSDGMTEEIINALSKIKGLKVTSRTSSFFFKNKSTPLKEIGEALKVSTILEGSIRLAGNKMRITAQLIDVKEDFHFWSETFDRSIEDIFAVQDEISLLIADKLREHLGHFEITEKLVDTPDISVDHYKNYLRGRYLILKMTKSDIEEGMTILNQIISENPDYPLAYLGIHLAYTMMGTIGYMPAGEAFGIGHGYLVKALEIDQNLPEAQLQLAYIAMLQKWDFNETYYHLNKSFEIRASVEYYQSMAATLMAEGKFEAATHYVDTALQLDPFSHINYHMKGCILYCHDQYQEAHDLFIKARELNPNFMASTQYLGQTLLLMGQHNEGLEFFMDLEEGPTEDLVKLSGTTLAYVFLNEIEKADAGIKSLEAYLNTDLVERAMMFLIYCNALLRRKDKALSLLKQAIDLRLPMLIYFQVEPLLKDLRNEAVFKSLIKKVLDLDNINDPPKKKKYKKSLFDKDSLQESSQQLKQLMQDEKPYLDAGLSLRSLAAQIGLPPNHLSQLLNEGFDKNFSEFVNTYRLETFKEKVSDPANQHLTLLALAFDSGFNSKTVFNTYFKKTMGITPKAYWKNLQQ